MSWGYKAGGVNQHPYLSNNNRFFSPELATSLNVVICEDQDIFEKIADLRRSGICSTSAKNIGKS